MAEENQDQVPQGAIPPKAVPPQINPAAEGEGASPTVRRQAMPGMGNATAPVPRTVRLKPVGAVPATPSAVRSAPSPLDVAGSVAATDAIKRMTARIAMLAEEDNEKKSTGSVALDGAPSSKGGTGLISDDAGSDSTATVKKMTSRIQMTSTTVPIPDLTETPKTIRIRPNAVSAAGSDMAASVGPSGTQPVAVKAKTSRIPLESAMSVSQPAGGAATEDPADAAPRTIKLKRPGEMSTVKVPVHGAPAAAANEPVANNQTITQKKTIRVKRPTMPAAASVAEGGTADEAGHPVVSSMAFAAPAPERGTGWFIALSVACILLILGLAGLFAVQLYGSRPHTELDPQYQHG